MIVQDTNADIPGCMGQSALGIELLSNGEAISLANA